MEDVRGERKGGWEVRMLYVCACAFSVGVAGVEMEKLGAACIYHRARRKFSEAHPASFAARLRVRSAFDFLDGAVKIGSPLADVMVAGVDCRDSGEHAD